MERTFRKSIVLALALVLVWALGVQACTTVIVGKDRSVTGQVMVAHNEELGWNAAQHLVAVERAEHGPDAVYETYSGGSIPQPKVTWRYIASTVFDKEYYPGDFTTGVNEWGVTVANNMSWGKGVSQDAAWETIEGGVIWTEFTQLVLERARTAREGVELMGMLCETYHLSADPGTMYAIADFNEGWWIEIARDGQWIAVKVPDNEVSMRANGYRIGAVDLDDENVLHSPELVSYAKERGWYSEEQGAFDFAKVYGDPWCFDAYSTLRHRMVEQRLQPIEEISRQDLMSLLRWNYEGTEYYEEDAETGSPWGGEHRTIARLNTEISSVVELRKDLPKEIGSVVWWCMNTPKTGVFIPWYFGTTSFPSAYTRGTDHFNSDSAYWRFYELKMLTHHYYNIAFPMLEPVWQDMESSAFAEQTQIEQNAVALLEEEGPESAQAYLTKYSGKMATAAFTKAGDLIADIKTKAWFQD